MARRWLRLVSALVAFTAGGCEAQEVPTDLPDLPADAVAVPFEPIEQLTSPIGGPPEPARRVIRDQATWVQFWSQISRLLVPPPDPPTVEFGRNMILVAAMGRRPTAGYRISIEGVYESDGALFVDVLEVTPGVGCLLAQMLTAPVTGVLVTVREWPVQFVERKETQDCM